MIGLLEMFYSPAKVFDRVRERGTWLPAFLAILVMALLATVMVVQSIGLETIVRKQIEKNPQQMAQLGPEGIARAANSPVVKGLTYGGPVIVTPLMLLAMSGLFAAGLAVTGSKTGFSQVLGATCYAWWPYSAVTTLMSALIVAVAPNKEDLNIQNLIATNAGAFLDPATTNKALYAFASSMDVLSFGVIALLGYGLARVSGRSWSGCLVIVVVLWLFAVIGKVGLAAATSR